MISHARTIPARVDVREVRIPLADVTLSADLAVPARARGLVIFAHGSGSGRHSARNRYVADVFQEHRFATLLAELLTLEEEIADQSTRHLRFDVPLLGARLAGIAEWAWQQPELKNLDCGYFGASTGAAAALIAAAGQQQRIKAVVSRGGRPDLAGKFLPEVNAPVLLLVGGYDPEVLLLNEQALRLLNAESRLELIPRASHLFEETGALEAVAQKAAGWFSQYMD